MSLIECPECGREVSSSAAACPSCAYPAGTVTPSVAPRDVSNPPDHGWWTTALSILGRIAVGTVIGVVGGVEEGSVAAIIGGVLIGTSAIPTWYWAKIERLKSGRGVTELEDRFEGRMAEFAHSQQEQMDRLEQMHAGQMTELEERLDFAERLLTKQREQIGPG